MFWEWNFSVSKSSPKDFPFVRETILPYHIFIPMTISPSLVFPLSFISPSWLTFRFLFFFLQAIQGRESLTFPREISPKRKIFKRRDLKSTKKIYLFLSYQLIIPFLYLNYSLIKFLFYPKWLKKNPKVGKEKYL